MKKLLTALALVSLTLLLTSCDFFDKRNTLTVTNDAHYGVTFTFRGKGYDISPGATLTLKGNDEVPPGIFEYASAYIVPAGASVTEGSGLGGSMDFTQRAIVASLQYISVLDISAEGAITYEIDALYNSNEDGAFNPKDPNE